MDRDMIEMVKRQRMRWRAVTVITAFLMMLAIMVAQTSITKAATYGYQPEGGGSGSTWNSVAILDEDSLDVYKGITVLETPKQVRASSDVYFNESDHSYWNRFNDEFDISKKDYLKFTFLMSAGTNNFNEQKFLEDDPNTGKAKNIDNIKVYKVSSTSDQSLTADRVVAQYDEGYGDLMYLGKQGSGELNNQGGTKTKALYIGVKKDALRNGTYVLQFGNGLRGNNDTKTILYNVNFYFTVKTTPELPEMISQAQAFLDQSQIGTEPGMYPQDAANALKAAIEKAKADLADIDASADDETTKENKKNEAAGVLYDALDEFKNSRTLDIKVDSIDGIGESVEVGKTGMTTATVSCTNIEGEELAQYSNVTWTSSSGCLTIDRVTGKWYAKYAGTTTITATSKSQPDRSSSKTVTVTTPGDVEMAICKSSNEDSIKSLIEKALEGTGKTVADIKSLRITTLPGIDLNSTYNGTDLHWLQSNLTSLTYLDLKGATVSYKTISGETTTTHSNQMRTAVFRGMTALEEVILPDSLTGIPIGAFEGCTNLKKVDIPAAVKTVGGGAFSGCENLESTMTIYAALPPSYTSYSPDWGDSFNGVSSGNFTTPVKTLYVPAGCAEDYKKASGWKYFNIVEMKSVPLTIHFTSVGGLEEAAIRACAQAGVDPAHVTHLTITSPDGVYLNKTQDISYLQKNFLGAQVIDLSGTHFDSENVQSQVFENRTNVKEYIFSDAITHFGKKAFQGNSNLRSFTIPEAVGWREGHANNAGIGESCFVDCPKLDTLIMNCIPPGYDGTFPSSVKKIYVFSSLVDTYKSDEIYGKMADKIYPQVSIDLDDKAQVEILSQVKVGNTVTWNPNPSDKSKANKSVTWEILARDNKDISVATVNGSGTVTGAKYGTVVVRATYDKGGYNECTDTCTVTVARPAAVKATAKQNTANSNTISWTAMNKAEGYQILRSDTKDGTYAVIQTVTAGNLSYVDQTAASGKTYYYKVCGYKKVGGAMIYGEYSVAQAVTTKINDTTGNAAAATKALANTKSPTALTEEAVNTIGEDKSIPQVNAKKISTVAKSKKKIMTVKWKKAKGATNYLIAYKEVKAKKWTYYTTGNKNSYIIKKMKLKGLYQFKLAAVKSGKRSAWSAVNYRYYQPMKKLKVKAGKKQVVVTWKKDAYATGYQIMYSAKKNMKGAKTITVKGGKKSKRVIKGLKKGKKYYVKVRPYKTYKGKKYIGILSGAKKVRVK